MIFHLKCFLGLAITAPVKTRWLFILFWLLVVDLMRVSAQQPDTTIIIRNDTIIKLIRPGSTPEKINGLKLEELLKRNSERSLFSRKLHDWLVKSSFEKKPPVTVEQQQDFTGKIIKNIYLISIPPFGGSVYDTTAVADSWLEKLGNKLRFETSPRIIRKTITISEGSALEDQDLEDSERLLRGLSFINDARIITNLSPYDTATIDVRIYVQDQYPHAVSLSFRNDQPHITLINKNILGRGFALSNSLAAPAPENARWGFRETFTAENLLGRYVNLEVDYSSIKDRHFFSGSLNKSFLLPETKYAGGLSFNRSFTNLNIADYPYKEWEPPLDYRRQNYWLGRSFSISTPNSTVRSNFYLLGRHMNLDFYDTQTDDSPIFRNGHFYFTGVGISRRSYYRNNLIYSFGKTEDVPYGFLSTVSYGYHKNDSLKRHFLGLHYSIGKALIPSRGYIYFSGDLSSYFNKSRAEQGVLNLRTEYITPLIPAGTSQFRGFFEVQYVRGFNRLPGENLLIDERVNGLRGFDYRNKMTGSEKALFKAEQVFFTRLEPLGFKFAIFSFLDMAFLRESNRGLFEHSPYYSFGVGLRIRNDHMVFNTLQIRLAIMPRVPSGELPVSLRITGEPVKNFTDFAPGQPGVSAYY